MEVVWSSTVSCGVTLVVCGSAVVVVTAVGEVVTVVDSITLSIIDSLDGADEPVVVVVSAVVWERATAGHATGRD